MTGMNENLARVEEKAIRLITELEEARKHIQYLFQKINALETEKKLNEDKLKDILSLLDVVAIENNNTVSSMNMAPVKLVQA